MLTSIKINDILILEREAKYNMKKIIRFIKDRDIFIIFDLIIGILTYMIGLRDRAEDKKKKKENQKIKIEDVLK